MSKFSMRDIISLMENSVMDLEPALNSPMASTYHEPSEASNIENKYINFKFYDPKVISLIKKLPFAFPIDNMTYAAFNDDKLDDVRNTLMDNNIKWR